MKKDKKPASLWFYFVAVIFVILFVTSVIMAFIAIALIRSGALELSRNGNFEISPVLFLLFISIIIGTAISMIVAKKILNPITRFSKAVSEVAKGNFDIRLDEKERIKELKELTQNFNIMAHELSCTETLRNDFVDNVSHEFKTPISAINGYATLLQDKTLSEAERDEYIKFIIDSSKQLSTLSENILNLSKLENQEAVIDRKDFRIDEQIRETVLLLENNWGKKDIDLEVDLDKIVFNGNKGLLAQIWLNLIDNAIKFTPRGGKIGIRLYKSGDNIITIIKDTGRGIDQSEIHHIFDKFYQGDKSRKETGNGLGLALVLRIINLSKGNIEVQSEPGKGSEFTVSLPVSDNAEEIM
ncbi:MAG: HAMP domain-containing histidine kinase [Oscillospiraceae bacterium]|nr:HAMP domain-containing histidine kinase [Oscillospiraceae bacterium]